VNPNLTVTWPLHDLVITNLIRCSAYKREVGRGVVYCLIIVQSNCTRVGDAGGRGNERMVDSCTTASKSTNILYRPNCNGFTQGVNPTALFWIRFTPSAATISCIALQAASNTKIKHQEWLEDDQLKFTPTGSPGVSPRPSPTGQPLFCRAVVCVTCFPLTQLCLAVSPVYHRWGACGGQGEGHRVSG